MSAASTISPSQEVSPVSWWASRPLCTALVVTALVTAGRLTGTVDSDVSWQLWIAGRLHAGAHLYRDIVETNPPLWFWMAVPIERLGSLLDLPVDLVLIVAMAAATGLSIFATDRLLGEITPPRRTLLLGYGTLILSALPWMHVGQREQIVLIGAVPYAALAAARGAERPVSPLLAACVGTGAALGFALKHYFLLVPILLELWLITAERKRWRPLRPEIAAVLVVGLSYAIAVLFFGRDFLEVTLPLLRLAYGATGAPNLVDLFHPPVIVGPLTLGTLIATRPELKRRELSLTASLIITATAFGAAYFIQAKGWAYHALPLLGCSALALASFLATAGRTPRLITLAAPALLLLPFVLTFEDAMHEPQPTSDLLHAVEGLRPGESVGFIATDPSLGWTVTLQRNLRYASRYNGFWMMRAVVENELRDEPNPVLTQLGRTVVAQTVADFRCIPPRRIIVARPRQDGFDILPFFGRNPEFSALLAHYKPVQRTSLEVYELASPMPDTQLSACRAGV